MAAKDNFSLGEIVANDRTLTGSRWQIADQVTNSVQQVTEVKKRIPP
jgi:hypothetical protein